MKGLKITSIILFSIICLAQVFTLYLGASTILGLESGELGKALASALALLPLFLLCILGIFIFNIAYSIIARLYKKKLISNSLLPSKLTKTFNIIVWSLFAVDIVTFIIILL